MTTPMVDVKTPRGRIFRFGLVLMILGGLCSSLRAGTVDENRVMQADLLIVGGGESGCAAAAQAARMGVKRIVLVNDINWLGGQFSAESLVAIDENTDRSGERHEQPIPRSGLFREVIDRIEAINRKRYGVARPGNTRVITTCRPADAARAFDDLLKPYVASGQLTIVRNAVPVSAVMSGRSLKGVRFRSRDGAGCFTVQAPLTIDASDWGDVIKLSGAEYEFGPDLKSQYGEPEAPASREDYPATDMNPLTYCMLLVESDRRQPIRRPNNYDPRNYRKHRWPKDPRFLYTSRRIVDGRHFSQIQHPDVILICFPAIDYPLDRWPRRVARALEADERGASKKNIVQLSRSQRKIVFDDAKRYSLGFLYYLQTEVHERMNDKTYSLRRFRLTDEFNTPDSMPPKPYIRESLRLKAMYMMRQQDTLGWRKRSRHYARSMYPDAIACWQFEFDFHPTRREFLDAGNTGGPWRSAFRPLRNWGPPYTGRAQFPLRSLVPVRIDGLLGGQHNLGFSSIVSSAVRLHDHSMAVGQGAGAVAAIAIKHDVPPRSIPFDRALLSEVQAGLCRKHGNGVPAALWPFRDLPPDHPAFEAAQLLALRRALPLEPTEVNFHPDNPADKAWKAAVVKRSLATKKAPEKPPSVPAGSMTRGEFIRRWWKAIRSLPDKPFSRAKPDDADGDGIPDAEDPLPLTSGRSFWPDETLPPNRDGLPDKLDGQAKPLHQFNFAGRSTPPVKDFTNDTGLPFEAKRGHGWSRDISRHHRRRNRYDEAPRDTFLFTREFDRWESAVPRGRYVVTVCVGDAAHELIDQRVIVEGRVVVDDATTVAGEFLEATQTVMVKDGRLTVDLGRRNRKRNTCLNWLRIVEAQ